MQIHGGKSPASILSPGKPYTQSADLESELRSLTLVTSDLKLPHLVIHLYLEGLPAEGWEWPILKVKAYSSLGLDGVIWNLLSPWQYS